MTPRIRILVLLGALAVSFQLVPGTASAATRYEAESATISQGVLETSHTGFSGTGYVNGDNVAGSYLEFGFTAATAGTATLVIRYANGTTTARPSDVALNGAVVAAGHSFGVTAEFGNSQSDELNLIKPGADYGWPTCEGACSVSGMTNPKATWPVAQASPSGCGTSRSTVTPRASAPRPRTTSAPTGAFAPWSRRRARTSCG